MANQYFDWKENPVESTGNAVGLFLIVWLLASGGGALETWLGWLEALVMKVTGG